MGATRLLAGGLVLLTETNQTNNALANAYGIEEHSVFGREVGPGTAEIAYIKQDLAYSERPDDVQRFENLSSLRDSAYWWRIAKRHGGVAHI